MDKINKLLLGVVFSLLALAVVMYIIFPTLTGKSIAEDKTDVKTATFAVCEQEGEYVHCKDKIFASCNNTPIELNDTIFYCDGKKYNVSNMPLGEAYHLENWTDPRARNFITAWALSEP